MVYKKTCVDIIDKKLLYTKGFYARKKSRKHQGTPSKNGETHTNHVESSNASRISETVVDGIFDKEFHRCDTAQVEQDHQQCRN